MALLEERVIWHEGKPEKQVLVKWVDADNERTWEPLDAY